MCNLFLIYSSLKQKNNMHVTKDEIKCENVKWKMWWYEEDFKHIMQLTRIQWIQL